MSLGAVFDWDGVVVDSRDYHEESWERLAREEDFALPDDHFLKGFGMRNEVIIPEILKWTRESAEVQRLSLRKEAIYREIVREKGLSPLSGVVEWLRCLQAAKIPSVIASSAHRENITTSLEVLRLQPYFQAIVSSEDVSRGKPDPEVFLTAAGKIGTPADEAVVFEDALVGIEAGHAAGMKVVAVATTNPREKLAAADRVVDRLDELTVDELVALVARPRG